MRKVRDVLRLSWGEQLSLRQVARSLSMPHTTVAVFLRRAKEAGLTWPLPDGLDDDALERRLFDTAAPSPSHAAPDFAAVKKELATKGVTLQLVWLEYKELHPDGYGYSQFCHLYRTWRRHQSVVMRQDHKAAEKLFVDYPGMTIPIYDERDLTVSFEAELFVAVLGASSYTFAVATRSQRIDQWIGAHVATFEFLGGCPEIIVPDNLRSGVTKAHRYEPDVNATYQEMASHYGVAIIPARPYKPRDKAKVEVGVQIAERWIIAVLRHQRFTSLSVLNETISELVEVINHKPFKKMEGSRATLFAELDQPALRPLPSDPYEFASWRSAKVNIEYHVEVDRHYYSVPYQLAGQVLNVRLTSSIVEIFAKNRRWLRTYAVTKRAATPRTLRTRPTATVATSSGHPQGSSPGRRRTVPRPLRSSTS